MTAVQTLGLLLAVSSALNVAVVAGLAARHGGSTPAQAILTGGAAAATMLTVFFAAVAAYTH